MSEGKVQQHLQFQNQYCNYDTYVKIIVLKHAEGSKVTAVL